MTKTVSATPSSVVYKEKHNYNIPAFAVPGSDQSFSGVRATCDVQGLRRLAMAKWPETVHTPAPQRVSISVLEKVRAILIGCARVNGTELFPVRKIHLHGRRTVR